MIGELAKVIMALLFVGEEEARNPTVPMLRHCVELNIPRVTSELVQRVLQKVWRKRIDRYIRKRELWLREQ